MPDFIKLTLDVAGGEYQADLYVKMYDVIRMVREDNRTTVYVNGGGGTEKSYYVRETPDEICEQHDAQWQPAQELEPAPEPEPKPVSITLYTMLDAILKRFPVNPAPRSIALAPNHFITTLPVGKDHTLTLYGHADDFNALENLYLAESTGHPVPPKPTAANEGEANGK